MSDEPVIFEQERHSCENCGFVYEEETIPTDFSSKKLTIVEKNIASGLCDICQEFEGVSQLDAKAIRFTRSIYMEYSKIFSENNIPLFEFLDLYGGEMFSKIQSIWDAINEEKKTKETRSGDDNTN